MEESKKNLKVTSYVIIVLAIVNVILLGIGFATGQLKNEAEAKIQETMQESGASAAEIEESHDIILNATLYGTIGGIALGVLLDVYLGIKGLHQSEGKIKGKGNIVWAKIIFVLSIISIAMSIIPLTKGQVSVSSFISSLAGAIIIFYYLKYAKEVVEGEEA